MTTDRAADMARANRQLQRELAKSRRICIAAVAVAFLAVGGTTLAACDAQSKATQQFQDAPHTQDMNTLPAQEIQMPDGFNNAATKCLGNGLRITTSFHNDSAYAAVSVVPDATCTNKIETH